MVSAAEALRSALHEGVLEKKRRTGGWRKKHYVLTSSQWLYFDSIESLDARSSLATAEILKVQRSDMDPLQRNFSLVLYKKRKEYRALSTEERDDWVQALESIAVLQRSGDSSSSHSNLLLGDRHAAAVLGSECEIATTSADIAPIRLLGPNGVDLVRVCEQMKKSFAWQLQISKSFAAKDVVEFIKKHVPDISTPSQVTQLGQDLLDHKLIVPLKSHVFDEHDASARFKFADAAAAAATTATTNGPKQPRNHLTMRAQSVSDLMGNAHFNARKYAEDFLKKHASDKIDSHCKKLIGQKEQTIEELKEEISANYTSFIHAASEIKRMENSVSQLKTLVLDCKRSLTSLRGVSLDLSTVRKEPPGYELAEKRAAVRATSRTLDSFVHDLEVHLHERSYDDFARLLLAHKQRQQQTTAATATDGDGVSGQQQQRLDELQTQFVKRLVDEFNASMQTSERRHKNEHHLQFLIALGHAQLATEMCLQNYSVRIALQLRHVPSHGNALNYVINLSRTFFTSLLVCYEDYEQSFRGQKSAHFVALTVWISAQLERFAHEIIGHIFPQDLRARSFGSSNSSHGNARAATASTAAGARANCVALDVPEFKNVTKFVASALRYVFYGSRQLELAGLPTAHCLAPHLVHGLASFLASYTSAIKGAMTTEVKRERWEMLRRTIRDTENRRDVEIILTQSARSFYAMVQQFLRDVQRVLNPSCATSYLADVHDAVVLEADELLVQYTLELQTYLESAKTSSSLRLKQVVGLLTNVAYVHDDCAARSTHILLEYLPKAALLNRDVDNENAKLWRDIVVVGVKRCAQSLLKMSIRWTDVDLSDEQLPDVAPAAAASTLDSGGSSKAVATIFVTTLLAELESVSNEQLEQALRRYRTQCLRIASGEKRSSSNNIDGKSGVAANDSDNEDGDDDNNSLLLLVTMVLEATLDEIRDDETWWQQLQKDRRIGYAGMNKLIVELRVVQKSAHANKRVQSTCNALIERIVDLYRQLHPGKKDVVASHDWTQAYMALCKQQQQEAATSLSVATSTSGRGGGGGTCS